MLLYCTFKYLIHIMCFISTVVNPMSNFMPWSLNVRCVQYLTVLQFYCDASILHFMFV